MSPHAAPAEARLPKKRLVAATEIVGGEIVVCAGNALGPVIARFPRTEEGYRAALAAAEGRPS